MMATKEQEMAALKKIRKIVEGLGENSYIGTAFEGCFEIAEENIESDFACSMKQRWESATEEAKQLRDLAEALKAELETKEERLEAAERRTFSVADLDNIYAIVSRERTKAMEKADTEGRNIVKFADDPSSEDFKRSVNRHRTNLKLAEAYGNMIEIIREKMYA